LPLNSFPGRILALVGFLAAVYAAYISFGDMKLYGGADISGRIVGARVLMVYENPYKFQWAPGKDEKFADPLARYPGPTRSTYTPTLLAFYALFSDRPYSELRPA